MMTPGEAAMIASMDIPTYEGPSTSRSGDNDVRKLPSYGTETSDYDSDLSLLQAQSGSRYCGTMSRMMTSGEAAMVA